IRLARSAEDRLPVAKLRHLRGTLLVCHVIGYTDFTDGPPTKGGRGRRRQGGRRLDAREAPSNRRRGRPVKAATIRDVAERAAVSVASVSRVLTGAGPVTEATRARVLKAVDELQYVPHSGARSLSTSKT